MTANKAQKALGSRLKAVLAEQGKTQAWLAKSLGVTPGRVSQWISGSRACPLARIDGIADLLGIDAGYLKGDYAAAEVAAEEAAVEWYFRHAPDDGGRDYGNSNVFATPPDTATLVRETGQNSKDQRVGPQAHLRFHLIVLKRGSEQYRAFLEALEFDQLHAHLSAASATRSRLGNKLKAALRRLEDEAEIYLLRIDDYGTTGLYGPEGSGDEANPFAALVRNNLDSSKRSATAGGSFGLGKAVLWRCSDISTVLFSSSVPEQMGGKPGLLRFAGKSELTWHHAEGEEDASAGPGWLGLEGSSGDSAWRSPSSLKDLFLDRASAPQGAEGSPVSGTSALVVAFRSPKGEGRVKPAEFQAELAKQAALNFWPALSAGELQITVSHQIGDKVVDDLVVDVSEGPAAPFVAALEAHNVNEVSEHPEPGEVARATAELSVPATVSEPPAAGVEPKADVTDADCVLLVRLAEPEELNDRSHLNSVALVRGSNMVVRYWPRSNIVVGARPFHAVLLAGDAAGSSTENRIAEVFLRLSEPPAHNKWEFNEDLRDNYQRGSGRRIEELEDAVTDKLRDLVKPDDDGVEEEPEALKRLLQLKVPPRPVPAPAKLQSVTPTFNGDHWTIDAEVKVLNRENPLRVRLPLSVHPESGAGTPLAWETMEVTRVYRGSATETPDHALLIAPRTTRVRVRGRSSVADSSLDLSRCLAQVSFRVETLTTSAYDDAKGKRNG